MFAVACARCGTRFEGKTARAAYCSASCRALASRDRKTRPQPPSGVVVALPGVQGDTTIRAAVLVALGAQQDTVAGRQALALADRLDSGASDGAWSAMSKRLGELLAEAERVAAEAMAASGDQVDPVEFLKARGERRRHAG